MGSNPAPAGAFYSKIILRHCKIEALQLYISESLVNIEGDSAKIKKRPTFQHKELDEFGILVGPRPGPGEKLGVHKRLPINQLAYQIARC